MELVQPIREKSKIEEMKRELLKSGSRDYMLFVVGINTGLRISDILTLKVADVKGDFITIKEQKTDKYKKSKINGVLKPELENYIANMKDDDYLFASQKQREKNQTGSKTNNVTKLKTISIKVNEGEKVLTRIQAYRILNKAGAKVGIDEIGTHTLRKTFGYFHYQMFKDVALLQDWFNHSAPSVTLKYIGINQDNMDKSMDHFGL